MYLRSFYSQILTQVSILKLSFVVVGVLLYCCSAPMAQPLNPSSSNLSALVGINSILLVEVKPSGLTVSKKLSEANIQQITSQLKTSFKQLANLDVFLLNEVPTKSKGPSLTDYSVAAHKSGVDAILIGEVQKFSERSGSAMGSDQGAAFGIGLKLFRAQDKVLVWEGNYSYSDEPAPIISISEGKMKSLQFLSVDKVVKEGCNKLAAEFAAERLKGFTRQN